MNKSLKKDKNPLISYKKYDINKIAHKKFEVIEFYLKETRRNVIIFLFPGFL